MSALSLRRLETWSTVRQGCVAGIEGELVAFEGKVHLDPACDPGAGRARAGSLTGEQLCPRCADARAPIGEWLDTVWAESECGRLLREGGSPVWTVANAAKALAIAEDAREQTARLRAAAAEARGRVLDAATVREIAAIGVLRDEWRSSSFYAWRLGVETGRGMTQAAESAEWVAATWEQGVEHARIAEWESAVREEIEAHGEQEWAVRVIRAQRDGPLAVAHSCAGEGETRIVPGVVLAFLQLEATIEVLGELSAAESREIASGVLPQSVRIAGRLAGSGTLEIARRCA